VRLRHAFRNALLPIVTLLGPTTAELLAGSFIIENMFSFPGFGNEYWQSIRSLDYSMIIAVTLLYAVLIVASNLVVDLLYGWLDPRVRQV
jgi:ABC-type dipeptide/oligopeptide/nickel transport system permease component